MHSLRLLPALVLSVASLAAAQSATMTVPGLGQVMAGSGSSQTLVCAGDAVTINGSDNRVTLAGRCLLVTVNGNRNRVTASTVGRIVIHGTGNIVGWQKALKGTQPVIKVSGSGNKTVKH